jgi:transcriptional regulator with XRE-family HTH domain
MGHAAMQRRLGVAIRRAREEAGYSQDSFADAIDMHRAYYSAIERGERNLTIATLGREAAGLKLTIAELATEAKL